MATTQIIYVDIEPEEAQAGVPSGQIAPPLYDSVVPLPDHPVVSRAPSDHPVVSRARLTTLFAPRAMSPSPPHRSLIATCSSGNIIMIRPHIRDPFGNAAAVPDGALLVKIEMPEGTEEVPCKPRMIKGLWNYDMKYAHPSPHSVAAHPSPHPVAANASLTSLPLACPPHLTTLGATWQVRAAHPRTLRPACPPQWRAHQRLAAWLDSRRRGAMGQLMQATPTGWLLSRAAVTGACISHHLLLPWPSLTFADLR